MRYALIGQLEVKGRMYVGLKIYDFKSVHFPDEIMINHCTPDPVLKERWLMDGLDNDIIKDYKRAVMKHDNR